MIAVLLFAACFPANHLDNTNDPAVGEEPDTVVLGLVPFDPIVVVGAQVEFTAKAFFPDTHYEIVTETVEWASTQPSVASVDEKGLATALTTGSTEIVITEPSGQLTTVDLTVIEEDFDPISLHIKPASLDLVVGTEHLLSALATYPDDSTGNLASSCDWWVSDPTVAMVDNDGLVLAKKDGETQITADCDGVSDQIPVTVWEKKVAIPTTGDPDLLITAFEGVSDGWWTEYTVTIRNDGETAATGFWLDLWYDRYTTPTFCEYGDEYVWVEGLEPDESATYTTSLDDGPWYYWDSVVLVDSCDDVTEKDETNNIAWEEVLTYY
ncbi:MAG: hypothetical protein HN348_05155 [Proteobacteria bacterium]|nr:hypothetical protein [Pseudomonadota bacterium]